MRDLTHIDVGSRFQKLQTFWLTPIVVVPLFLFLTTSVHAANPITFAAIGDFGDDAAFEHNNGTENVKMRAVANLIIDKGADFIVTTGDNSYTSTPIDTNIGKYYADYIGNYSGSYGSGAAENTFFPSVGNHDISDGGGINAYLSYFTLPGSGIPSSGTSGNERYYDFVRGPVHFFSIDSYAADASSSGAQAMWLQTQLAASSALWKIVYDHNPPFSSSTVHGSDPVMQWPYEEWGATAVLSGHDHTYERVMKDDNSDDTDMPYFVTGLGGRSIYGLNNMSPVSGSVERYNDDYGTMIISASDTSIVFEFWSLEGGASGTLEDTYTIMAPVLPPEEEDGLLLLIPAIISGIKAE